MKDDVATAPPGDVPVATSSTTDEPRVRLVHADVDDPEVRERLISALRDVLSGRVG